jgi:hypothetical protein
MKLNVPEILKVKLVDDWEAVTKNNQVRSPFFKYYYLRRNKIACAGTAVSNSRGNIGRIW